MVGFLKCDAHTACLRGSLGYIAGRWLELYTIVWCYPLPYESHRNKLLLTAGMQEGYTLKDVMRPDRQRVQKALSGIINLQKFKESVQEDYHAHELKTVCVCLAARLEQRILICLPRFYISTVPVYGWIGLQDALMNEGRGLDKDIAELRQQIANAE